MVSRPTMRSSSAMRCGSSPRPGCVAKISGARLRNSAFQRQKTGALNWCSRQISATVLTPVSSSITSRALNSGLKFRRLAIGFSPFLDSLYIHYRTCPVFGVSTPHPRFRPDPAGL